MDMQTAFNVAIALAGAFGGYVLKAINDAIIELRKKDDSLAIEVHQVHLLVAGSYVKREEMDKHLTAIFEALRRIEDRISTHMEDSK